MNIISQRKGQGVECPKHDNQTLAYLNSEEL